MRPARGHELPPHQDEVLRRAVRLEWLTVAYLLSAILFLYLTLGASQAMRTAWIEDMLSLIPAVAFLVANRIRGRDPNERYPYGYHRAVTIAFLCAALSLFLVGALLLYEAISALVAAEHPTIGSIEVFGRPIWLGWLMIPALVYSGVPAQLIGRKKLPLARELHDKVLHADAAMNRADWLAASAAIVGVLGIGLGLWWADGVAAAVISLDILRDGATNLRGVISDLLDSRPTTVDHDDIDGLPGRVVDALRALDWVADAQVRMREHGHVYFGEAFVVPADERPLPERIERAVDELLALDWRIQDLVIMPVASLEPSGYPPGSSDGDVGA